MAEINFKYYSVSIFIDPMNEQVSLGWYPKLSEMQEPDWIKLMEKYYEGGQPLEEFVGLS